MIEIGILLGRKNHPVKRNQHRGGASICALSRPPRALLRNALIRVRSYPCAWRSAADSDVPGPHDKAGPSSFPPAESDREDELEEDPSQEDERGEEDETRRDGAPGGVSGRPRVIRVPLSALLSRMAGLGPQPGEPGGDPFDFLQALLSSRDDLVNHLEDMQMQMAMQMSLRDFESEQLSYEHLSNLEDVKVPAPPEVIAKLPRRQHRATGEEAKCTICQVGVPRI